MTRNFDLVGSLPFPADKVAATFSSIDDALRMLQAPPEKPPLPPAGLTPADRLVEDGTAK